MKKILSLLLTLIVSSCFVACNVSVEVTPEYSNTYSFNKNLHWRNQINGSDRTDVGAHVNDGGKCKVCDYYYDASEFLTFVKVKYNDQDYYAVYEFKGTEPGVYTHIEIPTYHQKLGDPAPLPVIGINSYAFASGKHQGMEKIRSVKFNEGLKFIGSGAFSESMLTTVNIPDSVTNGMDAISGVKYDEEGNQVGYANLNNTARGLYNTFSRCLSLKRAVIGNGVKELVGYVFSTCSVLEEVIVGSSVSRLATRDFYCCENLKYVVLPATLVSVTESSIWSNAVKKYVSLYNIFEGGHDYPDIFMYMTREQYKDRSIKKVERDYTTGYPLDKNGNPVNIDETTYSYPSYGLVEGWCGFADLYFMGEWDYNEFGVPVAN